MTANKLIFKDAVKARDAILDSQKKEIAKLYENWADEIGERAKYYSHKSNASAGVSERYMRELQKQIKTTSQQVSNEVYGLVKNNIYTVADAMVKSNVEWFASMGVSRQALNGAFSSVPDSVVRKLVTGQIYDSGWSLSKQIWGDNERTLQDVYRVVAKGMAENRPIYDIAKELENYVRPSAKMSWNTTGKDGVKIFKKSVDYNAQRLARTLVQHGYQQSFLETTKDNPFVTEYIWISNGSRVCELCMERNGKHFKKTELPMDHPNGMCVMEPAVVDDIVDQLANWFNSPDGTYPEIDAFANNFGYTPAVKSGNKSDYSKTAWYKAKSDFKGSWYQAQKHMDTMAKANGYDSASSYWKAFTSGKVDDSKLGGILGLQGNGGAGIGNVANSVVKTKTKANSVAESVDFEKWKEMLRHQRSGTYHDKLLELEEAWERKLIPVEKKAVYAYTTESSNSYVTQNGFLRFKQEVDSKVKETVKNIQSALSKATTKEDMMLLRGTSKGLYTDIFKGDLKKALDSGDVDKMAGHVFKDPGFLSTSPNGSEFSGDLIFHIFAPKGTKGGYVELNNHFGEREFLLQSDTSYFVEKAEKDNYGNVTMFLRILV